MTTETSGFIDLFQVDRPDGNKPHYKGFIKLNGEKLEFACWPAKSGKPGVYSGKVKPAQERGETASYASAGSSGAMPASPVLDDSIPF